MAKQSVYQIPSLASASRGPRLILRYLISSEIDNSCPVPQTSITKSAFAYMSLMSTAINIADALIKICLDAAHAKVLPVIRQSKSCYSSTAHAMQVSPLEKWYRWLWSRKGDVYAVLWDLCRHLDGRIWPMRDRVHVRLLLSLIFHVTGMPSTLHSTHRSGSTAKVPAEGAYSTMGFPLSITLSRHSHKQSQAAKMSA